jgi:uncharacterized protein (TIGR02145 family)
MKKISLLLILLIDFGYISFSQIVNIGTQVWMTKNLDVSTFRNGDPIPQAKSDEEWEKAGENNQPAWCYYKNDQANDAKYGKLYNWYAVIDSRGLAPVGFHIPSDAEWTNLVDFLGSDAGTKMKSKSGWNNHITGGSKTCPNCVDWNAEYRRKVPCHTCRDTRRIDEPKVTISGNGNNTSGFSGLPGGARSFRGVFGNVGEYGTWWSSTDDGASKALVRGLIYSQNNVHSNGDFYENDCLILKGVGVSVRCLRD